MANARSVRDKLDELTAQLLTFHMDIAIITETWLHDYIDNNILTIPGYNIARRDRHNRIGGGVCAFVSSEIPFKRRSDLESPEHECLWLWLRPHRLPRPLSGIICGVVYFPVASAQVQRDRTKYIIETLDSVKTSYPDCGVVLLGDFNTQDISDMLANHNLKQVVMRPTRGNSILDLILTDFSEYYSEPIVSAQLGSSDHGSVHWNPLSMNQLNPLCVEKKRIPMRRFPQSAISAFGSKAFDHIDHTILVNKLIHLGVRGFIIRWICSFLYGRRQAVKIKNIISPWLPVHAGVPQGTKLGPILFLLMINDLAIETPLLSSHWKYVDDLTISEAIPSGGTSSLQKDLDAIAQWSSRNNMNLNPNKCKELVISSPRTRPDLGPLCVNGRPLERVSSHKVLGVTISDTLGWNEHVREIVSKASKRLYILRVLKRSGIPPEDLINIFYALVRSVLEYACVTWSTSLPIYLKDMIERVQKRALRILFPALSYKDAIVAANSTRLNVRRDELCKKVWGGICVPGSRLYHLIPPKRADCHVYELRNKNHVSLFKCRTERFKKSFFPTMASNAQFL
ncbi:RNA-directed DNA polymerase from mobile element jockey [Stylophora pistillata]|uniref:RNA-directed DNA polymerase from mobile element jockey n=1 Tax=Stylophora pistillata TaxID=50429 RepID=A0A2B4SEV0_STYPI|nr:RNA-directed DNA polymerase from mobile element jockey [Stylophora pistillata]